uniref:rRNA N-glycosylase n=1 Tax=Oryza punctata TaxID=4537 RepID=A0A0E0LIQ0_ORYPU
MSATQPKFTDSFIVSRDNYGNFIRIVRQDVMEYCSDVTGVGQPVLPPEQQDPKLWFHVDLLATNGARPLTLAIRMDNLYLVGFRTPAAGVWWEFNNEQKKHLINDAEWLGFGGRYQDLVGQKELETIALGRAQMAIAVNVLAKYGTNTVASEEEDDSVDDPQAQAKSALAKLVIMVCEGLRFLSVSGTVDGKFDGSLVETITQMEAKQVNKWDRISAAVFKWAKDPSAKFPDLEQAGVKDKNDAARIIALVKNQN